MLMWGWPAECLADAELAVLDTPSLEEENRLTASLR
jgi:hypothetical protein